MNTNCSKTLIDPKKAKKVDWNSKKLKKDLQRLNKICEQTFQNSKAGNTNNLMYD